MNAGDTPLPIDVDLTGVKQLVLWLRDAKGGDGNDNGDWANATITYDGAAPVAVDSAIPRKILTPPEPLTPRINGPRRDRRTARQSVPVLCAGDGRASDEGHRRGTSPGTEPGPGHRHHHRHDSGGGNVCGQIDRQPMQRARPPAN